MSLERPANPWNTLPPQQAFHPSLAKSVNEFQPIYPNLLGPCMGRGPGSNPCGSRMHPHHAQISYTYQRCLRRAASACKLAYATDGAIGICSCVFEGAPFAGLVAVDAVCDRRVFVFSTAQRTAHQTVSSTATGGRRCAHDRPFVTPAHFGGPQRHKFAARPTVTDVTSSGSWTD